MRKTKKILAREVLDCDKEIQADIDAHDKMRSDLENEKKSHEEDFNENHIKKLGADCHALAIQSMEEFDGLTADEIDEALKNDSSLASRFKNRLWEIVKSNAPFVDAAIREKLLDYEVAVASEDAVGQALRNMKERISSRLGNAALEELATAGATSKPRKRRTYCEGEYGEYEEVANFLNAMLDNMGGEFAEVKKISKSRVYRWDTEPDKWRPSGWKLPIKVNDDKDMNLVKKWCVEYRDHEKAKDINRGFRKALRKTRDRRVKSMTIMENLWMLTSMIWA